MELQLDQQSECQSHQAVQGKVEFVHMDKETLIEFRKTTKEYMDSIKQNSRMPRKFWIPRTS